MLVTNDLACSRLDCRAARTAASSGEASDSTAPSLQQQQQQQQHINQVHLTASTRLGRGEGNEAGRKFQDPLLRMSKCLLQFVRLLVGVAL
jgi:hypothetical protein